MGEARLGLSRTEENRVLEGLIIFLTERAEVARVSVPPGDMCSKVAITSADLMNAATNKPCMAREGRRSETGAVRIRERHRRTYVQPVGQKRLYQRSSEGLVGSGVFS